MPPLPEGSGEVQLFIPLPAADDRQRILAALPEDTLFTPLMTLYLTAETTPDEVRRAAADALFGGKST